MTRVAVLGDTHVYHDLPDAVPQWVREEVAAADRVVHAGDFVTPDAVALFCDLAADFVAVRGNADVSGVDLPDVATLSVEGVTIAVTHPPGVGDASLDRAAYERAVLDAVAAADPDVAVAGHTHRVADTVLDGVRLLNPGSATAALPAERATILCLSVADGEVDVTVRDPDGEA
jgi:putative phosphoesterase